MKKNLSRSERIIPVATPGAASSAFVRPWMVNIYNQTPQYIYIDSGGACVHEQSRNYKESKTFCDYLFGSEDIIFIVFKITETSFTTCKTFPKNN